MGVVVGGVEGVFGEQLAAPEVVGEEGVGAAVEHPHRLPVRPDAARVAVVARQLKLALRDALAGLEVVGEEAVLAAVGDPHRVAVGPEAARRTVRLGELELALLHALAGLDVVGVDLVVGALAVLGEPQHRAVRPQPRRPVVAAVELLDVASHGPLEILGAGRGARGASASAATTNEDGRLGRLGDGYGDVSDSASLVEHRYFDGLSVVLFGVCRHPDRGHSRSWRPPGG